MRKSLRSGSWDKHLSAPSSRRRGQGGETLPHVAVGTQQEPARAGHDDGPRVPVLHKRGGCEKPSAVFSSVLNLQQTAEKVGSVLILLRHL